MSRQSIPLLTLTQTLSGSVAANRFVTVAGAQAGASANTLGVATMAGIAGDLVPVDVIGTSVVEAGAAISAGATLRTDALGRAIPWATAGGKVGIALQAAGTAGEFIEVLLLPNVA